MAARIAVVGPCASGKSTLVEALRDAGYDAWSVAQEHSMVADLWRRQHPDILVVLDVSLEELRSRRQNPVWPAWLLDLQRTRLADAVANADIAIDTNALRPDDVTQHMLRELGHGPAAAEVEDERS